MEFSLQDDEFGGDFPATNATRASGSKRSFDDLEDDEYDIFRSKKIELESAETEIAFPGVSLALLFFTVLSFGTLMTATLQWEGISATVGLVATVVYPLMQSRLSTLRTGLWSLWSQGILKEKSKFGVAFRLWQDGASKFVINGHYPVRE